MGPHKVFTTHYSIKVPALITDIGVSLPFNSDEEEAKKQAPIKSKAIWDTGATCSVITEEMAQKLELKPVSKVNVTGVHGSEIKNAYLVNIYLPNDVCVCYAKVTECKQLSGDDGLGMLIGMDVIGLGDFAVTNYERTTLSYRLPSQKKIDFIEETKQIHSEKISRNSPCPCGSRKKYKKCCGI